MLQINAFSSSSKYSKTRIKKIITTMGEKEMKIY